MLFFKSKKTVKAKDRENIQSRQNPLEEIFSLDEGEQKKVFDTVPVYSFADHLETNDVLFRTAKKKFTILAGVTLLIAVAMYFSSAVSEVAYQNYGADKYFAVDTLGAIKEIEPLPQSGMTDENVIDFSHRAAVQILNMSFSSAEQEWRQDKTLFSAAGYREYTDELNKKRIVDSLREKRENVTVVPLQPVVIRGRTTVENIPYFITEGFYLAKYEGQKAYTKRIYIKFAIRPDKKKRNRSGLVIDQIRIQAI